MLVSGTIYEAAPQNDADGLLFLVNRQYTLSAGYTPADLEMSDVPGQVRRMRPAAAEALREMFLACKEETKCQLLSISGFRSYEKQAGIYARKLRSVKKDVAKAQEYVAPPGASEHQTGLAMDIGQKHKVQVIRLVTGESIEEQVVELGARKKALFERLITPGETVISAMSEQEIRALFE